MLLRSETDAEWRIQTLTALAHATVPMSHYGKSVGFSFFKIG